jgi:ABC-type Fe3+ transport system permease subunit
VVYATILSSVRPDIVGAVEDRLEGNYEIISGAVPIAGWAVIAGYGFLALMFLLLALLVLHGSRAARGWTFTFGVITLLVAAPLGVVGAVLVDRLDPASDFWRELIAVVPSEYPQYMIAAGITGMGALLIALVLLMSRPVNRYVTSRSG